MFPDIEEKKSCISLDHDEKLCSGHGVYHRRQCHLICSALYVDDNETNHHLNMKIGAKCIDPEQKQELQNVTDLAYICKEKVDKERKTLCF